MAKGTKKQIAMHEKLLALRDAASQKVFDTVAPRNDVRWQECFTLSTKEVQDSYRAADRALWDFEDRMVSECRAHRQNAFGMFTWYTH